jgi:hypothetical protein
MHSTRDKNVKQMNGERAKVRATAEYGTLHGTSDIKSSIFFLRDRLSCEFVIVNLYVQFTSTVCNLIALVNCAEQNTKFCLPVHPGVFGTLHRAAAYTM